MRLPVSVKKLRDHAVLPARGSANAAAYDLRYIPNEDTSEPLRIEPGEIVLVPTGLALAIPVNLCGLILPRSSLAWEGLRPANTPGLIDPDYRGEVKVLLENFSKEAIDIYPMARLAQLLILEFPEISFLLTSHLPETVRGEGGFGSTGR